MEQKRWDIPRWMQIAVLAILLAAIGVGLWVRFCLGVVAVDGIEECGACHLMKPYLHDLKTSGHAGEVDCSDCHVPHDNLMETYLYKAEQGVHNSVAMYALYREDKLGTFKPKAKPETLRIIVDNCYRCHDEISDNLNVGVTGMEMMRRSKPQMPGLELPEQGTINCLDCHTGLVHDRNYRLPSEEHLPLITDEEKQPLPAPSR